MKAFSKITAFILSAVLLMPCGVFAKDGEYADTLYDLGIIHGTDKGYESEKTLTRAEAVTVIVRLLGEEDNLNKYRYEEKFADVPKDHWAYGYVMYCYENKITYGTGENTFSPDSLIDARQFVSLLLRTMGYDVPFEDAMDEAVVCKLFNSSVKEEFEDKQFTRGDMFYTVYRSLKTHRNDGKLMADYLASKGVITKNQAKEFDIYRDFDHIDELIENIME